MRDSRLTGSAMMLTLLILPLPIPGDHYYEALSSSLSIIKRPAARPPDIRYSYGLSVLAAIVTVTSSSPPRVLSFEF